MKTVVLCDHCQYQLERWPCEVRPHNFCNRQCYGQFYTGKKNPNISASKKGKNLGPKAWNWKGGNGRSKESIKTNQAKWYAKLRLAVMQAYGGPACTHCGFLDIRALQIDHINGGGNAHRRSLGTGAGIHFYQWLRRNDFPPGYQVLCANCNAIKRIEQAEQLR